MVTLVYPLLCVLYLLAPKTKVRFEYLRTSVKCICQHYIKRVEFDWGLKASENMSFSAFWQLPPLGLYRAQLTTKMMLLYIIALDKICIVYQYLFGLRMCFILAKCWKLSEMTNIANFGSFYCIWGLINPPSTSTSPNQYPIQKVLSFLNPKILKCWY